jgi:hypothetical protein
MGSVFQNCDRLPFLPETLRHRISSPYIYMLSVRWQQPAFDLTAEFVSGNDFLGRCSRGNQTILAITSISNEEVTVDLSGFVKTGAVDLISGEVVAPRKIRLSPFGVLWLANRSQRNNVYDQ